MQSYFERIWTGIPAGIEPEHFALREAFLRAHVPAGARALDVGCGEGVFSGVLSSAGAIVSAVDVAHEPIRRARARVPGVAFSVYDGVRLPFEDGSFELAWLGEVVEHVQDVVGLLCEVARVLVSAAQGGLLVLSTPDHGRLLRARLALSRRRFEAHFEPRADHVRFLTAGSLRALLGSCGFPSPLIRSKSGVLLACAQPA